MGQLQTLLIYIQHREQGGNDMAHCTAPTQPSGKQKKTHSYS